MSVTEKVELYKFDEEKYLKEGDAIIAQRKEVEEIADQVFEKGFTNVFLLGIGGTEFEFAQFDYLLNKYSTLEVYAINAADANTVHPAKLTKDSLVITSSASGTTVEIVEALTWIKEIGATVVVSHDAVIGDGTKIAANSYIGGGVKVGKNCFFHAGVNIGDRVQVGNDVILHHGVSLGADGFSFVTENPDNIEQARKDGEIKEANAKHVIFKIPSIGAVVIGNNVEIGANTAIDRGTIENTTIGDNTKIDDLVMIGHNCKVGEGCLIVSQVGIAGSCVIGDRVVIAGQAGLADHIEIGSDSIVTAKAGVTKSFPEKSIIVGIPAMPRKDFIKQLKTMKDAQEIFAKFRKYEPLLKEFEDNISK